MPWLYYTATSEIKKRKGNNRVMRIKRIVIGIRVNEVAPERSDRQSREIMTRSDPTNTTKADTASLQAEQQASLALRVKAAQASPRPAACLLLEGDFCQDPACL